MVKKIIEQIDIEEYTLPEKVSEAELEAADMLIADILVRRWLASPEAKDMLERGEDPPSNTT